MVGRVISISTEIGHIDAADERNAAIHDDGLFVMAVEGVLTRVRLAPDPCTPSELLDGVAYLGARGVKYGHRRTRPHEHPDVEPFRHFCQQLTEDRRPT